MEHLDHPSPPHFNDAKMARFCSFARSSLPKEGERIIVPFYFVQDCNFPSGHSKRVFQVHTTRIHGSLSKILHTCSSYFVGVNVKALLTSLNMAFLPI